MNSTIDVSRVLPYKNRTIKIKDRSGNKYEVAIRVMEKTLFQAYRLFKESHPEKVVSRRKFEKLRQLKRAARLVCCCTYHVNFMYLTKCVSRIILAKQKDSFNFSSNENLCKFLLCDDKNIRCITQQCNECKYFKKLDLFKELHCSKVCFENKSNCENHKIKVLQFEKSSTYHKDEEKICFSR